MMTIEETLTEVKFIAIPSQMGPKVIVIVPKLFHKSIKPLLGKQVAVFMKDSMEDKKGFETKFIASVSPMGNQYIVYIPKRFHKDVKALIGNQTLIFLKEAI